MLIPCARCEAGKGMGIHVRGMRRPGEPEHKAISGVREQRRHGHRNEGASHCFARCFAALRASAGFLRSRVPSVVTAPLAPGAKVPSETQTQHHPAPQGLHTLRRSRRACRHPSQCWRCQAIIELRSFGKLPPKLHCSITAQTCSHDWHQQHSGTAAPSRTLPLLCSDARCALDSDVCHVWC